MNNFKKFTIQKPIDSYVYSNHTLSKGEIIKKVIEEHLMVQEKAFEQINTSNTKVLKFKK